jgi:hypothetical protein
MNSATIRRDAPLQCGYLLREEFAELWEQRDGRTAWAFLARMVRQAKSHRHLATPSYGGNPASPC